jgi:hypothetical protein
MKGRPHQGSAEPPVDLDAWEIEFESRYGIYGWSFGFQAN